MTSMINTDVFFDFTDFQVNRVFNQCVHSKHVWWLGTSIAAACSNVAVGVARISGGGVVQGWTKRFEPVGVREVFVIHVGGTRCVTPQYRSLYEHTCSYNVDCCMYTNMYLYIFRFLFEYKDEYTSRLTFVSILLSGTRNNKATIQSRPVLWPVTHWWVFFFIFFLFYMPYL
jgi:hypothetical protein